MPMTTAPSTTAKLLLALVVAGVATAAACRRDETAPPPPAPTPPPQPAPSRPVAAPAPAEPSADGDQPAAGGDGADTAIVGKGHWGENRLYRFRLERVAACAANAPGPGPAQRPVKSRVSQFRGETSWVGALFSLEARGHLFATPRDLELHRGGVILNAVLIDEPLPGCAPPLLPKDLRAGDRLRGFALFEVPKRFRAKSEDPIVFSYRPTRWGGARRVEVPIPECFDVCPEPPTVITGKTAGRSRPAPRKSY